MWRDNRRFGIAALAVAAAVFALAGPARADADPPTLDQAAEVVRRMKEQGASNQEIARYVAEVTDRRLQSTNRFSLSGSDYYTQLWDPALVRNDFGLPLPNVPLTRTGRTMVDNRRGGMETPGRGRDVPFQGGVVSASFGTLTANWSWDNRSGNCHEASMVTSYILQKAGIPARSIEKPGHDYTVMGLAPDADPNDPRTWGPDAVISDGWTGEAIPAAQAVGWKRYVETGRPGIFFDGPNIAQDQAFEQTAGRGNVEVVVVRASDGSRVEGARVLMMAHGVATNPAGTTAGNGTVSFTAIEAKTFTIEVTPPAGSGLRAGGGTLIVVERARRSVTISLQGGGEQSSDRPQCGGCGNQNHRTGFCTSGGDRCGCMDFNDPDGVGCGRPVCGGPRPDPGSSSSGGAQCGCGNQRTRFCNQSGRERCGCVGREDCKSPVCR